MGEMRAAVEEDAGTGAGAGVGASRTISPCGVIMVRKGLAPSGYADGGAVGVPAGSGTQMGVLSEAMPAWSDMWRSGIDGSEWSERKVVRKRERREAHREGA